MSSHMFIPSHEVSTPTNYGLSGYHVMFYYVEKCLLETVILAHYVSSGGEMELFLDVH